MSTNNDKTCRNCKRWIDKRAFFGEIEHVFAEGFGKCESKKIGGFKEDGEVVDSFKKDCMMIDLEDPYIPLDKITGEDFGCTDFVQRKRKA